jgi:hypothetical protein
MQALSEQSLYPLSLISDYFGDGVSQTICLGWPRTVILPISVSQVSRLTGMSCWHLAPQDALGEGWRECLACALVLPTPGVWEAEYQNWLHI